MGGGQVRPNPRVQRTRVARCARPGSPLTRHPLGPAWNTFAVAAILCTILSVGCSFVPHRTVASSLRTMAKQGPGTQVRLSDLTDFKWSRFVWLDCYTSQADADAALGFPWPDYKRWDLEHSDSFSLIVFAEGQEVVRAERLDRGDGEFVQQLSGKPFTPVTAEFRVVDALQVNLYDEANHGGA